MNIVRLSIFRFTFVNVVRSSLVEMVGLDGAQFSSNGVNNRLQFWVSHPPKNYRGQTSLCLQKVNKFFFSFFFSLQPSSALKEPAAIESTPTLQSNPVGQATGISSSMASPLNLLAITGAVQQPWQSAATAAKAGKESLVCDENRCVGVFQGGSLDRIRSTLVKRFSSFLKDQVLNGPMAFASAQDLPRETCATPVDDPLCPTKNASLDHRLEAVGPRLPVAAGHKGGPRRGKTRTGGRRSCTFLVWFLLAATVLMVDVVQAVFTPADSSALKNAVTSCLSETGDGSCPTFADSNGVMGDWDVSKVTNMGSSTSTSVSTLFVHWTVSLICFFDFFLITPYMYCLLYFASFLALHLFVPIDFDVSGGG